MHCEECLAKDYARRTCRARAARVKTRNEKDDEDGPGERAVRFWDLGRTVKVPS